MRLRIIPTGDTPEEVRASIAAVPEAVGKTVMLITSTGVVLRGYLTEVELNEDDDDPRDWTGARLGLENFDRPGHRFPRRL